LEATAVLASLVPDILTAHPEQDPLAWPALLKFGRSRDLADIGYSALGESSAFKSPNAY
jgi:hypothetical protein